MKIPSKTQYPKSVMIPCKDGDFQAYDVKWVRRFDNPKHVGECDPGDHVILLKLGESRSETFKTFIHEVMHALDFEGGVRLTHRQIYQLEEVLFHLLMVNV